MCNYCLFYFFVFYCIVYCIVTRHSLVRAKGEVLVLLYVCLFVWSTISQQPAGRFKPSFACGRILVLNVSSPLLGLAAPGGRKKWEMKFSLLWESMGNFCILAIFERYLSNARTHPHQILFVYGQCLPTCPLPLLGPSAPGAGEGS